VESIVLKRDTLFVKWKLSTVKIQKVCSFVLYIMKCQSVKYLVYFLSFYHTLNILLILRNNNIQLLKFELYVKML